MLILSPDDVLPAADLSSHAACEKHAAAGLLAAAATTDFDNSFPPPPYHLISTPISIFCSS